MPVIDLTGQLFGRLTAIRRAGTYVNRKALWQCRCSCGKTHYVDSSSLRRGLTKSCGCLQAESRRSRAIELTGKRGDWPREDKAIQ
jgi:hypothetical protein